MTDWRDYDSKTTILKSTCAKFLDEKKKLTKPP